MSSEHLPRLSPEELSFSHKDYYLTVGETSTSSEQEVVSSAQSVVANSNETNSKAVAEIEKSGENFASKTIDHKTAKILLKIFARNSTEDLTVPESFKSFLQQYANDPFLKNYLE